VPDVTEEGNWVALEVGKRLEDLVAEIFSRKTGFRVWQEKVMFQHPLYPFMLADIDYFFETPEGEVGILECKTSNVYGKEKWDDDSVPYHYEIQCRHYMAVKNVGLAYCACLFSNSETDFVYRRIDRDLDFEEVMIEQEEAFWYENVQAGMEPMLYGDGDLILASLRRYKAQMQLRDEITIESSYGEALEQIWQMKQEKAVIDSSSRKLEQKIKNAYAKFAELLGNATKGLCVAADGSEYHVTYKPVQRTGINKDNLQKMMLNDNEVYRKYVTTTESRAFQVKKIEHKGA
ncbi:MAG: YqaJ viral recombinase family protein, partial [Anaerotignum sp.]